MTPRVANGGKSSATANSTASSSWLQASPSLKSAAARVDQARASARISASEWAPDIRLKGDTKREQFSGRLSPASVAIPRGRVNSFSTIIDLSYEIDFWGKVRREVESARATADSTSASYHSAILTLTGDVAAQYFLLRAADAELTPCAAPSPCGKNL